MPIPEQQHLFCRLIDYYQAGDYSTFERICSSAKLIAPSSPRYVLYNHFQAASIAGFFEVSETEQSTRWASSIRPQIKVNSGRPKIIGTSKEYLSSTDGGLCALIEDETGEALIWGRRDIEHSYSSDWLSLRRDPGDLLGAPNQLMDKCIEEEDLDLDTRACVEAFDIEGKSWQSIELPDLRQPALVRKRYRFGGFRNLIAFPSLRLAYRVLYPEWTCLAAARLLRWEFEACANSSAGILTFDRRFRLPRIMNRYLFANSDSLAIGRSMTFRQTDPQALIGFRDFFWG